MKPAIDRTYLTLLSDVLGGNSALTDHEINPLLAESQIPDVNPGINRRSRIYYALLSQQEKDGSGECVFRFIDKACAHMKLTRSAQPYESFREELNSALAYVGFSLDDNGKLDAVDVTQISKAAIAVEEKVRRFRAALATRNVHPALLSVCTQDVLADPNYHRAALEAMRAMTARLKDKAGLATIGPEIADHAFALIWGGWPILAVSGLRTPEDVSQQYAHLYLMRGLLLMFFDERTRSERPAWPVNEQEALDLIGLISFCCHKIDEAVKIAGRIQPTR